jgi:transcriptional regulator with XRE-family HTH domain
MSRTPRPVTRAMARLGEDLGVWRRLQRLTVVQVADRAGVSRDTVMRLEKGENVSLENLLRVARSLGVLEQLAEAVDPHQSDVGRMRADEALPQRVRPPRGEGP